MHLQPSIYIYSSPKSLHAFPEAATTLFCLARRNGGHVSGGMCGRLTCRLHTRRLTQHPASFWSCPGRPQGLLPADSYWTTTRGQPMDSRLTLRSELVYTSSSDPRPGTAPASEALALPPPAAAHRSAAPSSLRHPGPQPHQQAAVPPQPQRQGLDPQSQRVVALLLRELDAARMQASAAEAEAARVKSEAQPARRRSDKGGHTLAAAAGAAPAPSGLIAAFRPAGAAPPPVQRPNCSAAGAAPPPARSSTHDNQVQALQQDNVEMRGQIEALYAHCRHLQHQLDAAIQPLPPHSPQQPKAAEAAPLSSPPRCPRSPGRTTVVVASPRANGSTADLAVAVFEASRSAVVVCSSGLQVGGMGSAKRACCTSPHRCRRLPPAASSQRR